PDEVALDGVDEFLSTCCATTSPWPHEPAVVDQCVFAAPDVFQLDDSGHLAFVSEPDEALRADVEDAADVCPLQAIRIED
ncbi:ferredoxin, partial [Kitasatospora sp. NPDC001159]